jgi:cob(I)alamin adenosyltransferase
MDEPIRYYSTTGDDGSTGLLGRGRVRKHHPRPETCGQVDEAQAAMGMARAVMQDRAAAEIVLQAQRHLYHLMAELAASPEAAQEFRQIGADHVAWLEAHTDSYGARISLPPEFSISGDTLAGAMLDFARTVVRRAERSVVHLFDEKYVENPDLARYLNRLSSLLFVLSRYEDALGGRGAVRLAKET